ncbi:cytidine deaminase [Melioribacteraceae bacterium 4301-Me]|uniref:cytidine deaminase n=1 Tax=Pyranulibacter aquaticus TaxID=3163344 RepID=UPI003598B20E
MNNYKKLAEEAIKAKSKGLPKYSNFHVGAALLTKDGKIFHGANIENSSYGLTICAERTAAFSAIIEGEREFSAIAIASDAKDFLPPCGACRQVLLELCGKELEVVMINHNQKIKKIKLSELIPFSFGEEHLKND